VGQSTAAPEHALSQIDRVLEHDSLSVSLNELLKMDVLTRISELRGGGLGSRPKKMYGERLDDGVEYHLMSPTPRR